MMRRTFLGLLATILLPAGAKAEAKGKGTRTINANRTAKVRAFAPGRGWVVAVSTQYVPVIVKD